MRALSVASLLRGEEVRGQKAAQVWSGDATRLRTHFLSVPSVAAIAAGGDGLVGRCRGGLSRRKGRDVRLRLPPKRQFASPSSSH